MRLAASLAWRYLTTRRSTHFISIIAFLTVGGIAIGVMTLITVLGVMTGFDQRLFDIVLGTTSHMVVLEDGGLEDWEAVREEVLTTEGVVAAAPFFAGQVLLRSKHNVVGSAIRGVAPSELGQVNDFYKNLDEGAGRLEKNGIVLGRELAHALSVDIGDEINIISPYFIQTPAGEVPLRKKVTVSGTSASGMYEFDSTYSYVQLSLAQALFGVPDRVTGLEVSVVDPYSIREQKEAVVEKLGFSYWVRSWQDMNTTFFAALRHEKIIMAVILFLILCVAAFNIASTLIMVVMDKAKDIGILKSIGMTSGRVQLIFFIQGLIVASIGLLLGNLGGWWLSRQLNDIVAFFEDNFGIGLFPSDIYYFKDIPVLINPSEVLAINAFAVIVALIAAWYPAWYASRLRPVEALRYE